VGGHTRPIVATRTHLCYLHTPDCALIECRKFSMDLSALLYDSRTPLNFGTAKLETDLFIEGLVTRNVCKRRGRTDVSFHPLSMATNNSPLSAPDDSCQTHACPRCRSRHYRSLSYGMKTVVPNFVLSDYLAVRTSSVDADLRGSVLNGRSKHHLISANSKHETRA
jgi:hypothetical protein